VHSSPNIIRVIKSRRISRKGNTTNMYEKKEVHANFLSENRIEETNWQAL
jgi:hypothetical protein